MTPDDGLFADSDDELNLLRHEAAALGMPGQITPASVGITLRPPGEMLTQQSRPRSGKKIAVRIVAVAASLAGVLAVTFVPWQQDQAAAGPPAVLEYQFADVRNIADAPGKDARAVLMKLSRTAAAQPRKASRRHYTIRIDGELVLRTGQQVGRQAGAESARAVVP